jgi:hypothetical protein
MMRYDKPFFFPPFFNNFIDKKQSLALFKKLFASLGKYKYWFLSYNSGAYPNKEELLYIIGLQIG